MHKAPYLGSNINDKEGMPTGSRERHCGREAETLLIWKGPEQLCTILRVLYCLANLRSFYFVLICLAMSHFIYVYILFDSTKTSKRMRQM